LGSSKGIAEDKMQDLNAFTVESAMKMVAVRHDPWVSLYQEEAPFLIFN
jgi:hypothetical protein